MSFELLLAQLRRRIEEKKRPETRKRRPTSRRRLGGWESLEIRQLLANDVSITGSSAAETIDVTVSGSDLVINGLTGGEQRYPMSSISSLSIDGAGQNDTIRINDSFSLPSSAAISFTAESIYVAANVSITGGNITLTSRGDEHALTIGSNMPLDIADVFAGDRVIDIGDGASLTGNDITLSAERISNLISPARPFGGGKKDVDIRIGDATLDGVNINVFANAEDRKFDDIISDEAANFANDAMQYVYGKAGLPIPLAVMIRESTSDIDLNSTTITASGTVNIKSVAVADATTNAMARVSGTRGPMSAGLSSATTHAQTLLRGDTEITAGGNVSIESTVITPHRSTAMHGQRSIKKRSILNRSEVRSRFRSATAYPERSSILRW